MSNWIPIGFVCHRDKHCPLQYKCFSRYLIAPIGDNARVRFSFPCPNTLSTPGSPKSSAVSNKVLLVVTASVSNLSMINAAAPDTLGAANDVPSPNPSGCDPSATIKSFFALSPAEVE